MKHFQFQNIESGHVKFKYVPKMRKIYRACKERGRFAVCFTQTVCAFAGQEISEHLAFFAHNAVAGQASSVQAIRRKLANHKLYYTVMPLAGMAAIGLSVGFAMSPVSGVQAYAQEQQAIYGQPFEVVSQRMADNAQENALLLYPQQSLLTFDTKNAVICTGASKEAFGVYVNGDFIAAAESEADLQNMLQDLLSSNTPQTCRSAAFAEEIQVQVDIYPVSCIAPVETVKAQLTGLSGKPISYTVAEQDSWESLAEKFGTTVSELKALNFNVNTPLQNGMKLSVIAKKSLLNITVVKEEAYEKTIDYETEIRKDDTQYTDYSKVETAGEEGSASYVDVVTYYNGKEVERTNVSTTVTKEPVTKVVVKGNKTIVPGSIPGVSSGSLAWPVPTIHMVSSSYGYRSGYSHKGIDIANGAAYGHTIVAADAGTVEFAKIDGSGYGKYIMINHGNGLKTMYAHTSVMLVSAGEKVTKGQPIAKIGSTGNSDGAHLHFEVFKNGVSVNPLNYVNP